MLMSPDTYLAAERTYLAWVRTCLAVLGFGLAFSQLFPVSIYGVNMSNTIAYCTMASAIFLLIDATSRYFIRLHDLNEGKFDDDKIGPAILFVSVLAIILIPAGIGSQKLKKTKKRQQANASPLLTRYGAPYGDAARGGFGNGADDSGDDDKQGALLQRIDELILLMREQQQRQNESLVG